MKILLISFHFPPQAPLPATRAPKLAKFLSAQGHDVRVLCANDPQPRAYHALEIAPEHVLRTPWVDAREYPAEALTVPAAPVSPPSVPEISAPAGASAAKKQRPAPVQKMRSALRYAYDSLICWPDYKVGWKPHALTAAKDLLTAWQPDVIYATAPPHTVILLAREIARHAGIPWVAEFRDRWARDAYSPWPRWRRELEKLHEARVLAEAAGIVTVSPVWAEVYRQVYGPEKIHLAYNGFDANDYPASRSEPPLDRDLTILYAGALYEGKRDPRPLLEAIRLLGKAGQRVKLHMYGKALDIARDQAAEIGVSEQLVIHVPIPHAEIVSLQYAADINLMLQWNDPRDAGTLPGKLFECMAVRRPVLATGYENGATAKLMRERALGLFSNDAREIATWLKAQLALKKAHGRLPDLPLAVREGFSRDEQFAELEDLLQGISCPEAE